MEGLLCVGDIEHDEFARGVDGLPDWESDGAPGQGTRQSVRLEACGQSFGHGGALRGAREIGAVERHRADSGQHELRFHERREMDVERQCGERRHVSFVDTAGGDDFEIGLAGECLHRRAEAAGGGVAREVDGYDYRHSERHGEDGERRTQ